MKRILIIGKNSYIGNSFKQYVDVYHSKDNWQIDCVGARHNEWEQYDFSGYDAILHVASIVHKKESKVGEEAYKEVNYKLPLKVAKRAKLSEVTQFVFLSTMAVYGDVEGRITEHTVLNPSTFYGKYKLMAEKELLTQSLEDFKVAVIRPPMVYGKGCKGNFARLVKLSKLCFVFPKIKNKRSMIYIDNLCEYLYLVMKRKETGIGCPQNTEWVETSDLVYQMRNIKKRKTILTTVFNPIIHTIEKKIKSLNKMFSDYFYKMTEEDGTFINIKITDYDKVSYIESIKENIKEDKMPRY